jgi:hypothetical protein
MQICTRASGYKHVGVSGYQQIKSFTDVAAPFVHRTEYTGYSNLVVPYLANDNYNN